MKKNKLQGIGLLELMLSIAIIAILLMMAMRYYMATRQSQQTAEAVSMIKRVVGAATEYSIANKHSYSGLSMAVLVDGGYLPISFCGTGKVASGCGTGANPWKGAMNVSPVTAAVNDRYNIVMNSLPNGDICSAIMGIVNTSIKSTVNSSPATCAGNVLTVLVKE